MSKGLGVMERVALRAARTFAEEGEPATRLRVASGVFRPAPGSGAIASFTPTRNQMTRFHHAARSLLKKGLLAETQWTKVLEVTASGDRALRALRGGPQRERLDLQAVRNPSARGASRAPARPAGIRAGAPAGLRTAPQAGISVKR